MFGLFKKKKKEMPIQNDAPSTLDIAMEMLEKKKQEMYRAADALWQKPVEQLSAKERSDMYFMFVTEFGNDMLISEDRYKAKRIIEIVEALGDDLKVGEMPDPDDSSKTFEAIDNRIARIAAKVYFDGVFVVRDWEQITSLLDKAVIGELSDDLTLSVASQLYTHPDNPCWEIEKGIHCAAILARRCYEPSFDLLKRFATTEEQLLAEGLESLYGKDLEREAEQTNRYLDSLGDTQEAHLLRGLMYFYGFGMPQDFFEAKREYLQADQQDWFVKNLLSNPLLPDDEEMEDDEDDEDDEEY